MPLRWFPGVALHLGKTQPSVWQRNFTVKRNITMSPFSTGCLSGWWPRKYFTWRAEATDRCLSGNTAFIKASAGREYRGSLRLYPPAAIKTAKSQAWEELAEAVLRYHRPDLARQQSALGVKPPHPLHTSLLSLSPLWRLAFSPLYLPVQTAAAEQKPREPRQHEVITPKKQGL